MKFEVCITTHNCSGGGGDGVISESTNGSFSLTLLHRPPISLGDFVGRYQSLAGAGNAGWASASQVAAVPEPATGQ